MHLQCNTSDLEKEKNGKGCKYSMYNKELDTKISIIDDVENEEKKRRPVLANIILISNHFYTCEL